MIRYVKKFKRPPRIKGACGCRGCQNPVMARGWCYEHHPRCDICGELSHARNKCNRHYLEWYTTGDRNLKVPRTQKRHKSQLPTCTEEGCGRNTIARNMCMKHYKQWQREGFKCLTVPATQRERSKHELK